MKQPLRKILGLGLGLVAVQATCQGLPPENRPILYQEKSAVFYGAEGTRQIPIQPSGYRLDYQSQLRIVLDTNELSKAIHVFKANNPAPNNLPALTQAQEERLDLVRPLVEAARNVVSDTDMFIAAYDEYKTNTAAISRQRMLDLNSSYARSKTNFLEPLLIYCEAKIRAEKPLATDDQIAIEGNDLAERFSKKYPGEIGLRIDLPALAEFVAAETKAIKNQVVSDAETVRATAGISLRMRAFRIPDEGDRLRLHIEGYDTVTNANIKQEPRISYQPSERDLDRLNSQTKAIAEGIKLSKDLNDSQSDLRKSLDSVLAALRGDLRSWKSSLTNLDNLQNSLKPIITALDKAGTSAQLTGNLSNLIVQVKADLNEMSAQIKTLRDSVASFTGNLSGKADSADVLITAFKAAAGNVDTISKLTTGTVAKIKKTLDDLEAIRTDLATLVTQDPPKLQDLAEALKVDAPTSVEALRTTFESVNNQYPELITAFKALWMKADRIAAAENFPPIELDSTLIDVSTVNPPDGFISLKDNYARGDAELEFSAALISSNATSGLPISAPLENRKFSVEKFGLINTWSANLIFVKRLGDLAPTEEESQFAPAPAVSWTLHYNTPPRKDGTYNSWENTWKTFDPGWGINVATLDWNDSIQVGLGSHISLFKDVITIGGGWNLNESKHGGYFFVGIGVFEAFGQLGLGKKNTLGR